MTGLLETQIPVLVVTISIILAGILIGIGRAFNYKKIERFGLEEFVQAIINAAIFGAAVVIIATSVEIGKTVQTAKCLEGAAAIDELSCSLDKDSSELFSLFQENVKILNVLGYYQTLNLNFGAFSIQPLANIESISNTISSQTQAMQLNLMLLNLNLQIVNFISKNALELLFVVGLIFRMLFATRRFGGFLIALAIGLYLLYPSFVLMFPSPGGNINNAINITKNFTNNTAYATVPIVDLNDNNAIAERIDFMSGRIALNTSENATVNATADFSGDLTIVIQANSQAVADNYNYSVVAPIFSLILTIVFIKELGNILGGEIGIASIL
ncbi:hypothetical protein J4450_07360 [Candidatus Micrarchaeota archaeon]|nr:hypothetical protein [Candidatus Micrarchaeota archaeon]